MALGIPAGIVFSYNGYTFPSNVRTKLSEEPITSGDNRVVKYSKLSIHVSGYITQDDVDAAATGNGIGVVGGTLDSFMNALRRRLQVHGKNLIYINRGYGKDLNVNPAVDVPANPVAVPSTLASVRDVAMGPKAGKVTWFSLGGVPDGCHGAGFEWEVSTCIAECEDFPQNPGPKYLLELSTAVTYDCDEAGLVTITTNGTIQIPLSLRANNTIDRTIDDAIGFYILPVAAGFLRRHSRQLSTDKSTATFTIVDRHIEVPYPEDVVAIDMKHRIRQDKPYSPIWSCSISGTIRMGPLANKLLAEERFFSIAAQRMAFARRRAVVGLGKTAGFFSGPRGIVLGIVEMEEDLFKNESRFTVHYRMLGAPIGAVVRVSGLWTPLGDDIANAASWTSSLLTNGSQVFGGLLSARSKAESEVIIDICAGTNAEDGTPRVTVDAETDEAEDESTDATEQDYEGADDEFDDEDEEEFPAKVSWVAWECIARRIVNHNQIRHKPLTGTVGTPGSQNDPFGDVETVAANIAAPQSSWETTTDDIIQQIATPSLTFQLTGFGVRIGHRVNAPVCVSYGGRTATLVHEDVQETQKGVSINTTMYRTDWTLTYMIAGPTATLPLPADPMLGLDGE